MKPSEKRGRVQILQGDCVDVLKRMDARSFDGCLCDPPYGLSDPRPANSATPRKSSREAIRAGFMGMKWDSAVPPAETWAEVLRFLNPGAFMMAFGGTRTYHRLACAIEDAGFEIRDCIMWLYGSGFPKHGSCLKPAWEPIIVARKRGRGLLNIEGCRIGTCKEVPFSISKKAPANCYGKYAESGELKGVGGHDPNLGRWPANLILDEEAAAALDEQSGWSHSNAHTRFNGPYKSVAKGAEKARAGTGHRDSGGASRFFYCAKASRKERGEGNVHPTVKPLKLTE